MFIGITLAIVGSAAFGWVLTRRQTPTGSISWGGFFLGIGGILAVTVGSTLIVEIGIGLAGPIPTAEERAENILRASCGEYVTASPEGKYAQICAEVLETGALE